MLGERLRDYRREHAEGAESPFRIPGGVCSLACEIARYRRWRAALVRYYDRISKEKIRYRKEQEWINKGKLLLKQTRAMLRENSCAK